MECPSSCDWKHDEGETADDKYLDDAIARIEEGARNGTEVSLTPP